MYRFRKLLSLLIFLLSAAAASAQCVMCKASAESSQQNGATIVNGLNAGIVYLMGIPYILLGIFCFVFRQDIAVAYHRWRKTEVPSALLNKYRFLIVFFAVLTVLFLLVAYFQLRR